MKKIEIAYEILSESRRNFEKYSATGRDFDMVHAHMYSIFECYAHGIIDWRTVEKKFQRSLKEYVNLYSFDKQAMLEEKARMLDEYTRVLEEYKPALDEYKRVHEQKMTSNIVVKKQISESVAQEQSNFYFNKRSLKEADLKDITKLKTWKRVLENYPNLTAKDEQRIRMLTIFEGPTVDTTQLITSIVTEYGKKKKKKVKEAAPTTSMRPQPRPAGIANQRNIGSVSPSGGTRGIDPRLNYSQDDFNRLTGQTNAPAGTPRAPVSSPRPQQRPADLPQRAAINRAVRSAMGEGAAEDYIVANAKERMADLEPAAREAFLAQLEKSYPGIRQKIGESSEAKYRVTAKSLDDDSTFKGGLKSKAAADAEAEKLRKAKNKRGGKSFDNVKVVAEGYKELPKMDRERYDELPGMEGPFMTMSGKVVYYDPKEGAYYDRDTDMYMSYEEFKALDNDRTGMREALTLDYSRYMRSHGKKPRDTHGGGVWMFTTAEYGIPGDEEMFQFQGNFADAKKAAAKWAKEKGAYRFFVMESAEEGTYAMVSYDYHDDWGSIELIKDGETVEDWNDYFGANETGNPLAAKFVELSKKHGINPTEIDILSGDDEDIHPIRGRKKGRFDGKKFTWNVKEAAAKIACLKCDEVSTAKAWEKNNGFCPKCKTSSQGVAESMNEAMSDEEVDAFHRALDALVHKYIGHGSHEKDDVDERKMTKAEKSKEERLKKKYDDSDMKQSMKDQYGDRWEEVYYATIRKRAMEQFNEMTSAGAIAAVAQPLGKIQRRNKVKEDQMMTEEQFDEAAGEKDACYHKVKSRYKVWPSAYASGALVQCRKVGAKNWGNKSK